MPAWWTLTDMWMTRVCKINCNSCRITQLALHKLEATRVSNLTENYFKMNENACFSLLVFREQWKWWTVYRELIKCGQRGHIPTAKCRPPPPTQPNLHTHTPHRSKRPSPPFAPCHVHLLRGYYGCTSVWEVCSIWHLTFHCCSVLQRPLLGKILLSSLTSGSRNLLDTAAENSPGWIASASNNAQFHIGIHMYFFHCAALQKVMTFCFFKALIKKKMFLGLGYHKIAFFVVLG